MQLELPVALAAGTLGGLCESVVLACPEGRDVLALVESGRQVAEDLVDTCFAHGVEQLVDLGHVVDSVCLVHDFLE